MLQIFERKNLGSSAEGCCVNYFNTILFIGFNLPVFRYHSKCIFQHTGMELADGLKVCMAGNFIKYTFQVRSQ